jgi:hypothetical protein
MDYGKPFNVSRIKIVYLQGERERKKHHHLIEVTNSTMIEETKEAKHPKKNLAKEVASME